MERALHYREVLRSNVLPVGKPEFGNKETGKRATVKWKEFEHLLQTRTDIERLFRGHQGNMALMVGRPNALVSFDIDSREAKEFADANLPETPLVFSTGREGGEHRLFKAPEIDLATKIGRHGGDFKGTGYVVIPPSIHYLGRQYKWNEEPTKELFDQTPVWPVDVLVEEQLFPEPAPVPMSANIRQAVAMTLAYIEKMPPSISGSSGHSAAFRVACKVRDRLAPLGLRPKECVQYMQDFNKRCVPEWDEDSLLHKLEDAWKKKGF